jgi:cytochrome c oxidase subunit 4
MLWPWSLRYAKLSLVVLFFMHLRWSTRLMRMVLVSSWVWLAILRTLTLSDFSTRNWIPVPTSSESAAQRKK